MPRSKSVGKLTSFNVKQSLPPEPLGFMTSPNHTFATNESRMRSASQEIDVIFGLATTMISSQVRLGHDLIGRAERAHAELRQALGTPQSKADRANVVLPQELFDLDVAALAPTRRSGPWSVATSLRSTLAGSRHAHSFVGLFDAPTSSNRFSSECAPLHCLESSRTGDLLSCGVRLLADDAPLIVSDA